MLTHRDDLMFAELQIDGNWLFANIAQHVARGVVNVDASMAVYDWQMSHLLDMISECLYNDISACFDIDDLDDNAIWRMDALLEEYMPELLVIAEKVLDYIFDVIRQYRPPADCPHRRLDRCLEGYTPLGDHAGVLHFDFSVHENHNSL